MYSNFTYCNYYLKFAIFSAIPIQRVILEISFPQEIKPYIFPPPENARLPLICPP